MKIPYPKSGKIDEEFGGKVENIRSRDDETSGDIGIQAIGE